LSCSSRSLGSFFRSPNLRTAAAEVQRYQASGGADWVHNMCSSENSRKICRFLSETNGSLLLPFRF
jgi:hypothetical protein